MVLRHLVFLGAVGPASGLRHEGEIAAQEAALPLVRKRSPWRARQGVERVIIGSDGARADVLLEGEGILPEHVRLYLPLEAGSPVDLLAIHPGSTRVGGRAVEPRDWTALQGGEEIQLGPWLFRYQEVGGA